MQWEDLQGGSAEALQQLAAAPAAVAAAAGDNTGGPCPPRSITVYAHLNVVFLH